jgi:hypothetical protein
MHVALVKRANISGRTAARRLDLDDIGAEVGQDLPAQEATRIGEIEDAIGAEEIISVDVGHGMVSGVER